MQLEAMHQQPTEAVVSSWSGLADTRPFRRFNRVALPSDGDGGTSWGNLVADLSAILLARRPQVLVCPHPQLDTHSDHRYATLALWQACQATAIPPPVWLLYANHLDASQDFPFGPAHSAIGLPPAVLEEVAIQGLYNVELDADSRRRKALALDLMHDLKRPLRWKKWWRKRLQRVFLGRPLSPYGEDDFFRKAVRRSELFIVADSHQVERLLRRS
jgi:LmbE family N-acetylglucosaminyl deacetylase